VVRDFFGGDPEIDALAKTVIATMIWERMWRMCTSIRNFWISTFETGRRIWWKVL
jgi:hypothetical protein